MPTALGTRCVDPIHRYLFIYWCPSKPVHTYMKTTSLMSSQYIVQYSNIENYTTIIINYHIISLISDACIVHCRYMTLSDEAVIYGHHTEIVNMVPGLLWSSLRPTERFVSTFHISAINIYWQALWEMRPLPSTTNKACRYKLCDFET